MIRILCVSFLFFAVQIGTLAAYAPDIMEWVLGLPEERLPLDESQLKVFANLRHLRQLPDSPSPAIVMLGGSTGLDFASQGDGFEQKDRFLFINLCNPRQSLVDSLRILDNVTKENCIIAIAVHPVKLAIYSNEDLRISKLTMGAASKFPIKSRQVDAYYARNFSENGISVLDLSPNLNILLYLASSAGHHLIEKWGLASLGWMGNDSRDGIPKEFPADCPMNAETVSVKKIETEGAQLKKYFEALDQKTKLDNIRFAMDTLQVIADFCKGKSWSLFLYETPYSDQYAALFYPEITMVNVSMEEFLTRNPVIRLVRIPRETFSDRPELFADLMHLTQVGRSFFRDSENRFLTSLAAP